MNKQKSPAGSSGKSSTQAEEKQAVKKDNKQGKDAASHQKAGTGEDAGGGKKQARKH